MFEYLKKNLLTGVGLALRSKKEIEEMAKKLSEKSKMSQDDAKAFLNDCQQKYKNAKAGFDKKKPSVEGILKKLDLPSRSDIKKLNDRIDDLIRRLKDLNK